MQCDVRFVAEDAKLAFAFVRRGAIPELAAHAIVPRVAGFSVAAGLLLSGRTFLGTEAVSLGLVSKALPSADVLPAAVALARDIAVDTAPVSVAVTKRLLWESIDRSIPDTLSAEDKVFAKVTKLPDAGEGIASFVQKREPRWTGRATLDILRTDPDGGPGPPLSSLDRTSSSEAGRSGFRRQCSDRPLSGPGEGGGSLLLEGETRFDGVVRVG